MVETWTTMKNYSNGWYEVILQRQRCEHPSPGDRAGTRQAPQARSDVWEGEQLVATPLPRQRHQLADLWSGYGVRVRAGVGVWPVRSRLPRVALQP